MSNTTLIKDPVKPLQLTEGELRFYNDEGYLYIPGLVSTEDAAALRTDVMHIMDVIGAGTTKLYQTVDYLADSCIDGLVNSPTLRNIVCQILGGPSTVYMPFTAVKTNGGGRFHFHQDNQYTFHDGPSLNCWIALNDMSPENGCLQVVPRSHLNGTLGKADTSADANGGMMSSKSADFIPIPSDFLPVRMRAGDCIVFTRLTIHGSGENTTPDHRVGYAIQYHRDDVNWRQKDGSWLNLKEHPRFTDIGPKETISIPTGKRDGH
jgi:2-oxoglutarate-dependent dioxygenase